MTPDLQLLVDSIRDALIILDKDGFIVFANPATTALSGYHKDELLGNHLSMLYNIPGDINKEEYELGEARTKGDYSAEGWKTRKDGSRFWGEMSLNPSLAPDGSLLGFSCIIRDVSAKKDYELEISESEERYRLLVEGVMDYSIFMLDPTGHIMTWNEGARRTKGYSSNEVIGKHFSIFYTAQDLHDKKYERELRTAVDEGRYEEEGWRVRKDGSVFWANVILTPLYNEVNKLIGFSKVTRDLSGRKEYEEALRESEERYRLLVEQVTDYGIFMLDEKGRIISWNEGARRIKGYEESEIVGKYFSIFYTEEDIKNGKPARELKIARTVGKYEEEGWRLRKDGSRFWANIIITAVYNRDGILIGYSKVTRDLTEKKASEKALRQSYEQYRMLTRQLTETNAELSYTNKELEQFTSIVSHDLQEPIRTIKSFLQLIDRKLNPEQDRDLKTYIEKSINAANRMRDLIHNLLKYSQLSKSEIVQEEVNVDELINSVVQNLRTSVDTSRANIVIENSLSTVTGDRVQLMQLLQNLLSNAIKFTVASKPDIKIESFQENGHVKFAVSDNGIGIEKGDLQKVFEIFRRLNAGKEFPGTGIGLAICKKIVDRHKGRIWPESEPGKGTTFYFTLNENKAEHLQLS